RGLDVEALADFGVPRTVTANTWRAGLDQLAGGIAAGDRSPSPYGPGGVALLTGLDDDAVGLFGALAELLRRLDGAVRSLRGEHTMAEWCERLRAALGSLCAVPDADAAQWRTIDATLDALIADTQVIDVAHPAPHGELAALVRARLQAPAGRARFGTGAVTVSSLTALRGVPFRVVCLLGLDGDLTSPPAVSLDDLTGLTPCLGDADPQAEVRAQLLDAVASAGERLLVVTSGFDVRTNGSVPPSTVVSELLEALGWDTDPPASAVAVHARHAWSDASFAALPGSGDRPWSFDTGALDGALARRQAAGADPTTVLDARDRTEVLVADLVDAVEQPCRAYLRGRLGISLPEAPEPVDDLVPLGLTPLGRWARVRELLALAREAPHGLTDDVVAVWADVHRRRGTLPPLRPGDEVVADVRTQASAILSAYEAAAGRPYRAHDVLDVDVAVAGRRVVGRVEHLDGLRAAGPLVIADVGASRLGDKHHLRAWIRLALVALAVPDRRDDLVAVTAGRARSGDRAGSLALVLAPGADPLDVLGCALEVADAADRARVPLFARTSRRLHREGPERAPEDWEGMYGDLTDRWIAFAYDGVAFDGLLAERPTELESAPAFGTGASRVERWAHRVWTCVDATVLERSEP
ncbi:MAG: exodeoxyribonuclease V subunit gamma, partial [Ilumatobacteraceae bacterium]|nr:exodeoxyribonuclease V subunit gamma [Ilumatobacteraceae bacterium]